MFPCQHLYSPTASLAKRHYARKGDRSISYLTLELIGRFSEVQAASSFTIARQAPRRDGSAGSAPGAMLASILITAPAAISLGQISGEVKLEIPVPDRAGKSQAGTGVRPCARSGNGRETGDTPD